MNHPTVVDFYFLLIQYEGFPAICYVFFSIPRVLQRRFQPQLWLRPLVGDFSLIDDG